MPLSISHLGIAAIAASSLCFVGAALAVDETSTAENPGLRPKPKSETAAPAALSASDKSFIQAAAAANEYGLENGKLAAKQGQSAEVKKIGARMASDHGKALNELVELAKKKGIGVKTGTIKAQNFGTKDFDRQYLGVLDRDLKKDIAAFEKEAKSGGDSDLKSWAAKTLPMLKGHLGMAKAATKK